MTREMYIRMAEAIRINLSYLQRDYLNVDTFGFVRNRIGWLTIDLMKEMKRDNPRFSNRRFLEACGLTEWAREMGYEYDD